MSWVSKLCLFALVPSLTGFAIQYQLRGNEERARLETHLRSQERGPASVEFQFTLPSVSVNPDAFGFQTLAAPGLTPIEKLGDPELFTTGLLVAVPTGFEPKLNIDSAETRDIQDVVVAPVQHKLRCSGGEADSFHFNSKVYRSNSLFPVQVAALEEVGIIQGVRIVRVAFYPTQNQMGSKTLRVTSSLKGRVTFVPMGEGVRPFNLSAPIADLVKRVAVNGENVVARAADSGDVMLIVVADTLKSSLTPLVDWKQSKGIKVDIATTTEAGGTKEKIKEYVQKYYDNAAVKPSYLLFVGNKTSMPTYMESTASGSAASDYRYALLTGADNLPDAFYGRLVADNAAEVTTQINRWIAYEKNPEHDATWYKDAMTIASDEGSGPSDKEYAEMVQTELKKHSYTSADQFYAGTHTATYKNISEALTTGRSWIAYFGHGSGVSWGSTNDMFGNTEVGKLKNTRLPVIVDVACLNASWVNFGMPFGKAWVTAANDSGAVAFYGGSVSISWHEPALMSVGVAKYHFEKPVYTLGGSVMAGQLYLIEKMGTGDNVWDNVKWYNLLGDPSMLMRTDTPAAYEVQTEVAESQGRTMVNVKATNGQGQGVANLLVAVRGNANNALALGKTNAFGEAELQVEGLSQLEPGTLLTTTGYNMETYSKVLQ
ncbi:MAG: hypothetical protein HYR96_08185 [Deltaproteobacteria bacterium]|nr:hypothetical protein [Deltaproteobacteria bacterium]MBI3293485.1 hypothetical protein [Deltaproteobacteria bacterium]